MFSILSTKQQESAASTPLFSAPKSDNRRAEAVLTAALSKAKRHGAFCEEFTLTPAFAEMLLAKNPSNRRISSTIVSRYAKDMAGGNWALNGEPIIVAETGELNDGQHRCAAVVQAGVPVKMFVTFGVDRDTRTTVDQGVRRTISHILGMAGRPDPNNLAVAARISLEYRMHGTVTVHAAIRPTPSETEEYVNDHWEALDHALTFGRLAYKQKVARIGLFAGAHHILYGIDPKAADSFSTIITENFGYRGKTDPIYVLHKRLVEGFGDLSEAETVAFVIKAWNAHRAGESIRLLKFATGEQFPVAE